MTLAAGTYRGRMGASVYAHDTGGSMSGRRVRHQAMGDALGAAGMHMGGVRLGSVLGGHMWEQDQYNIPADLITGSSGRTVNLGRAWRLGVIDWSNYRPEPAYVSPTPLSLVQSGLGQLGGYEVWKLSGSHNRWSTMPAGGFESGTTLHLGKIALGGLAALALALLG